MMKDPATLRRAARQEQFLDVVSRDEAETRFRQHLTLAPLGIETVPLSMARGRVLAVDMVAPVDAPGFDRASVDGFALRAADTQDATDDAPAVLDLNPHVLTPGIPAWDDVEAGRASVIATGGMVPRGADAVVMVEQTELRDGVRLQVEVSRPVAPGAYVAPAGSDIGRGETLLRHGKVLSSREIGMLAAVGLGEVQVWRRPRVAIFSTGDEIVAPGGAIRPGQVFDSNAAILAAAVEELGGEPVRLGIVRDDPVALAEALDAALATGDMVVLSGGTSKGAGDLAHTAVSRLDAPGIVVHGVALKPGKPLCLAVQHGIPVAVLPGFPTSAIFTFHEFVAPVLRAYAGLPPARRRTVEATLPLQIGSERGRLEYVMVSLIGREDGGVSAYPVAKGSGAVTSFAQADGFFAVPAGVEAVAAGSPVQVRLIGEGVPAADLVVIGSQCAGLDLLIGLLDAEGFTVKSLAVGSMGGLAAAAFGLAAWLVLGALAELIERVRLFRIPLADSFARLRGLRLQTFGTALGHDADQLRQVAEVADAPVVLRAQRIELHSRAPDAAIALQRGRSMALLGRADHEGRRAHVGIGVLDGSTMRGGVALYAEAVIARGKTQRHR